MKLEKTKGKIKSSSAGVPAPEPVAAGSPPPHEEEEESTRCVPSAPPTQDETTRGIPQLVEDDGNARSVPSEPEAREASAPSAPPMGDTRNAPSAPSAPQMDDGMRGDGRDTQGAGRREESTAPSAPPADDTLEFMEAGRRQRSATMEGADSLNLKPFPDIDTPELYPANYEPPGLAEAAREAGIRDAEAMARKCLMRAQQDQASGKYDKYELDVEDAATILMYTADRGGDLHRFSPYLVINQALESRDPKLLYAARHLIWKLLTALRKLPRLYEKTLFRGLPKELSYKRGESVCWHRFTSTTLDMAVTKGFMAKEGGTGEAAGTIFLMPCGDECWGYDLRAFSFFPGEEELLLEPERVFRVQSVDRMSSLLTFVHLEPVKNPLLLQDRIGVGDLASQSSMSVLTVSRNIPAPSIRAVKGTERYNSVKLEWDNVLSRLSESMRVDAVYEVTVKPTVGQSQTRLVYKGTENTSLAVGLMPETRYQAKCRIRCGENVSSWAGCQFTTGKIPPLTITQVSGTLSYSSVQLEWNDIVDRSVEAPSQEQMYTLEYAYGDGSFNELNTGTDPTYTAEDLDAGAPYRFRVKIVLIDTLDGTRIDGAFSDIIKLTTRTLPLPQPKPVDGTLLYNSMTLTWSCDLSSFPADRIEGWQYEIEGSSLGSSKDNFKLLYKGKSTSVELKNLDSGKEYSFRGRIVLPEYLGSWSPVSSFTTPAIPVPVLNVEEPEIKPRIDCRVTNDFTTAFSKEDCERLRFEFDISRLGSFTVNEREIHKMGQNTLEYSIRARVLIGDEVGPWSKYYSVKMPSPFWFRVFKAVSPVFTWIVWELGLLAVLFSLLFTFGIYYDGGSEVPLQKTLFASFFVYGSIIFFPLPVMLLGSYLPPIIGVVMLPFKSLTTKRRRKGAVFYGILLGLHYLCVMATLILMYLRITGKFFTNWLTIVSPLCAAFTVIPAFGVPALYVFNSKGRRELCFMTSITSPLWGTLLMSAAKADDIVSWPGKMPCLPLYIGFGLMLFESFCALCARICDKEAYKPHFKCCIPFGLLVGIPTYLVLPICLTLVLDGRTKPTLKNTLSPLYIDIIVAAGVSLLSSCIKRLRSEKFHGYLREQSKVFEIILCCRDE